MHITEGKRVYHDQLSQKCKLALKENCTGPISSRPLIFRRPSSKDLCNNYDSLDSSPIKSQ